MPIRVLPHEVVDQIAAGEVVERPAHMVKELVENALDAGADEVEIDFDCGGRLVRVKDNGSGILQSELPLALARHATSKIALSSDIWNLSSYGFRGEALATIAAVSRLTLTSKPKGQNLACSLTSEFGHLEEVVSQGGEQGTCVTVKDLFANVPARLKFMKSDAAEVTFIKQTVKALALANFKVSFRLRQQNQLIWYWPKSKDLKTRAEQVLQVTPLFEGFGGEGTIKAQVVVAPPEVVEKSSRQIRIFVQGRWVQDRGLQAAVMDAYRHLLMHGEYPVALVSLTCEPSVVDVNIHPAKSSVKFQNSSDAFRSVHRAVRGILEKAPWLSQMGSASQAPRFEERNPTPRAEQQNLFSRGVENPRTNYARREMAPSVSMAQLRELAPSPVRSSPPLPAPEPPKAAASNWQLLSVIGQAHLTYIIAQSDSALVLIDQHAAHERVAFERLMRTWQGGEIDVQQFLLPLSIELPPEQVEALLKNGDDLFRLGIHLETSGPTVACVRAAPSLLNEAALTRGLTQLALEASELGGSFAVEKVIGDLCATMACHSVVRAGQVLSLEQMRELLVQMDEFPLSSFCPHGRPVSVTMPWARLERDFGRTV